MPGKASSDNSQPPLPAQQACEVSSDGRNGKAQSIAAKPNSPKELKEEPHQTSHTKARRRKLWTAIGTGLTAIIIPVAMFVYSNADSHLMMTTGHPPQGPEIRGYEVSDQSITVMSAVYCSFTNSGLRSDYVDRIEVRPIDFDAAVKSEPRFVDRQRIAWREKKTLRFEILVTVGLTSKEWHDFSVTFYDSKGREVGQTPVTLRLGTPGDIEPKVKRMKPVGAGVWELLTTAAPPSRNPIPTLTEASIAGSLPEAYHDSNRRFFGRVLVAPTGELVAQTSPEGEKVKNGRIELKFEILSHVSQTTPLSLALWAEPPADPKIQFTVTGRLVWSDGSRTEGPMTLAPVASPPTNTPRP